jgi:hypothetical protein
MDLAPQESNGNTQLLVDNSVTSNLHHDDRNVRTTGKFIVVKLKMIWNVRKSIQNIKC